MRDEFSLSVKDALARRVGLRCSNPTCRQLTTGPKIDPAGVINVGVAAHITAAATGGPRHDLSLTPEARKSAENGIWLCQKCAKLIDSDSSRYSIQLLREWKQLAEERTLAELESRSVEKTTSSPDISIARLPAIGGRFLFGRERELTALNDAWSNPNVNALTVVAWGGVGKTALVSHWIARLSKENFRGADKVFGWSFYSQGFRESGVYADAFFDAALRWFGDTDPTEGTGIEKAERLAYLVRSVRTLLILDGLEPLQNPPGPDEGRVKDQALSALLRELGLANPGLCVVTTRQIVTDLEFCSQESAPIIELQHLSSRDGAALLKALGAKGEEGELIQASEDFGGHCLALNLLGSFLRDVFNGDVRCAHDVKLLDEDEEQGGHASRVMATYEAWFGEGAEVQIMRLIGLFDRPVDAALLQYFRRTPVINGLTDHLYGISSAKWKRAISRLKRASLLSDIGSAERSTFDAHPLVREYFARRLAECIPEAWREGHNRAYDHLKVPITAEPESFEDMAPLFDAVAHGCKAGRHADALDEVYWRLIRKGTKGFSTKRLGAFAADLTALRTFFETPWSKPISGLKRSRQGEILCAAGFDLRALGRLDDAIEPFQLSLSIATEDKELADASVAASNLSEVYLCLGRLREALEYAEESLQLAEASGVPQERIDSRTTLAEALHCLGRIDDAGALFSEAEELQGEATPEFPLLRSLRGFRYHAFLLEKGEHQEVLSRAERVLAWDSEVRDNNLATAWAYLSVGLAYALKGRSGFGESQQTRKAIEDAVKFFRLAGQRQELPRGLLAYAKICTDSGDFDRAKLSLEEAMAVALRGQMSLFVIDAEIEYSRWLWSTGRSVGAAQRLDEAERGLRRIGYKRRLPQVMELRKLLGEPDISLIQ